MRVLITGANGFIGKNLQLFLACRNDVEIVSFTRDHKVSDLFETLKEVDFVFHLAGSNRPLDPSDFLLSNNILTHELCQLLAQVVGETGKKIPIIYASSIQAEFNNAYGESKRAGENALFILQAKHAVPVYVFRLPNVFGKWCKPNYNSVVATFCHNISRGLPIEINNPDLNLNLVYVDDVINRFIELMDGDDRTQDANGFEVINPQFVTSVGCLAETIQAFSESRLTLLTERVGSGLVRALYSTYMSYLPTDSFSYGIPAYVDARGAFIEILKTPDCGQFSYFTALPGVTRGGHYHNSKTEKFLVIKGSALFKFRNMSTYEYCELMVSSQSARIVETIPGWAHDITNIGDDEMIVMLWANELFDSANPDTYACPI